MRKVLLVLMAFFMLPQAIAHADYQTLGLPVYNFNTNGLGADYPDGPSILGGVPFDIPDTSDPNISANAWHSNTAANNGGGTMTLEIPVGIYGVSSVYTLINTYWGQTYATARLEFVGDDTASYSVDLVGGWNVRDYLNNLSAYPDTINDPDTQQVFSANNRRLDMQTTYLPADFLDETLTVIRLVDYGNSGVSRTFLAGATVEASRVPVPAAVWLLGSGLLGLVGLRKKIKK